MFGSDAMMIRRSRESGPPDDEVWYYAPSQVTLYNSTNVQSHTFADGKGVLKFERTVKTCNSWFRGNSVVVKRVSLPKTVSSIDIFTFDGNKNLEYIDLPDTLVSIERYAFDKCASLALTSLPSALTNIGDKTFRYCYSLALTSIPSGITRIGSEAFCDCWGVTEHSITFLGTPASIASNAFNSNTKLTDIYVPWAEGEVANAPWGATNATIHYNS